MWGWTCINRWYRLAYQNRNSVYVPANQNNEDWHHTPDSCAFVCPQNVNLHISILKKKSIRAFINGNNNFTLGLYRMAMTGFVRGHLTLSPVT